MDSKNVVIYKLIPAYEARENPDGTYCIAQIINNTNQIKVKKVILNGKEYLLYDGIVR